MLEPLNRPKIEDLQRRTRAGLAVAKAQAENLGLLSGGAHETLRSFAHLDFDADESWREDWR